MDLEGYAKGSPKARLSQRRNRAHACRANSRGPVTFLSIPQRAYLKRLSREAERTLCERERSGVTMGNFGVGSRGSGDFYLHEKNSSVIGKTSAIVGSDQLDDSASGQSKG